MTTFPTSGAIRVVSWVNTFVVKDCASIALSSVVCDAKRRPPIWYLAHRCFQVPHTHIVARMNVGTSLI